MLIISIIVFLFLCYLLIRNSKFEPLTVVALFLKIGAGIGLGIVYKIYYQGGDTFQYFKEATTIGNYLLGHPASFFKIYFCTDQVAELSGLIIYNAQPRALLFSKIVSVFYIVTGGSYWVSSAFLSLISFSGIYVLVTELNKKFNNIKWAVIISFYFLPTFIFWSSGLLKESIAMAALCFAVAIVVRFTRPRRYLKIVSWLALIISLWLLWGIKYYYAAVTIPFLAILLINNIGSSYGHLKGTIMVLSLFLFAFLMTGLHYNLNPSRILDIIYENYQVSTISSGGRSIHYYHFDGSFQGFLLNLPIALFSGLFRPMIFEAANLFQVIVSLENLLVLITLLIALRNFKLMEILKKPIVIISFGYIIAFAVLLAFASPNFGTLSRYKVVYWPFFVLLVMILFLHKQKRPGS